MSKILKLEAREILDSRENPTIETTCYLESGIEATASVPSGKSTGANEALELRDNDNLKNKGKGVLKALFNINKEINEIISGKDFDQESLDKTLIKIDGTKNKSKLGANAILSVSIAFCKAVAKEKKLELYRHIGNLINNNLFRLPIPMFNIINGGKHSESGLNIQEFIIVPIINNNFTSKIKIALDIIESLKSLLLNKNYNIDLGDEGGFACKLTSNEEAFDFIKESIKISGYKEKDVRIGIDVASSNIFKNEKYTIKINNKKKNLDKEELITWYKKLINDYFLFSIEDGIQEEDFKGFSQMLQDLGEEILVIGDDLTVTNIERMQKAKDSKSINAVIIKPNQIGTVTETLEAIKFAKNNNWKVIVSHRSGETMDTFVSDLAVGVSSDFIKSGSPTKPERICKYNRLIEIENGFAKN